MDLALTPAQLELQARARAFVADVLQPLENDFERAGGRLDPATERDLKRRAIEAGLHRGRLPPALGGQGRGALPAGVAPGRVGGGPRRARGVLPGALHPAAPT